MCSVKTTVLKSIAHAILLAMFAGISVSARTITYNQDAKYESAEVSPVTFTSRGLTYYVIRQTGQRLGNEVAVTQCIPDDSVCLHPAMQAIMHGDTLSIPQMVDNGGITYTVTQIGKNAFKDMASFSHIMMPPTIELIGSGAFHNCTRLLSLHIPKRVSYIMRDAFTGCISLRQIDVDADNEYFSSGGTNGNCIINKTTSTLLVGCQATLIPASVKRIGPDAFNGCHGLQTITIPNGVEAISSNAFADCSNLHQIILPSTLLTIDNEALSNTAIESINIPKGVRHIGESVFDGCNNLQTITVDRQNPTYDSRNHSNSIIETAGDCMVAACGNTTIPGSVHKIKGGAFSRLSNIKSIFIPKQVARIDPAAFVGCQSLSSIVVDKANPIYDSRQDCNAVIETASNTLIVGCKTTRLPVSVRAVAQYAFAYQTLPPLMQMHEGVTHIGAYAFTACKGLKVVILPRSLKTVDTAAWKDCTDLESVAFADESITAIPRFCFAGCIRMRQIHLPKGCNEVADHAFIGCMSLEKITHTADINININNLNTHELLPTNIFR